MTESIEESRNDWRQLAVQMANAAKEALRTDVDWKTQKTNKDWSALLAFRILNKNKGEEAGSGG